jgi:hypothetical protein
VDEDELAVASISVAEYRIGIQLADSPERAAPPDQTTTATEGTRGSMNRSSSPDPVRYVSVTSVARNGNWHALTSMLKTLGSNATESRRVTSR